ncbi:hypothetical protein C8R47DRAFT_482572 [Mycena vitilis]|nr:hypothetical protein C8R47DRAFT_482572 [Mycena vitilis]
MSQKLVSTYIPVVLFPVLTALALRLIVGNVIASGLRPQLLAQCPQALQSLELTPYRLDYTTLPSVDNALCRMVSFFHLALTPTVRPLLSYFLGTSLPLLALPALESVRPNRPALLALPVLVGLAGQLFTAGAVLPLYWLLFILSGSARAAPSASTPLAAQHTQAVAFGLLIGAGIPSALLLTLRDPHVTALWQLFPLWQFLAQGAHLLVRPARRSGVQPADAGWGWVQALYIGAFVLSSSMHVATLAAAPSLRAVFLPSIAPRVGVAPELKALDLLQWDVIFAFGSTLLATLWFARTTRQLAGILLWNVVGSVVVGPGAAIAAVALWRESYLHTYVENKKAE